jgi:hypothetical protein
MVGQRQRLIAQSHQTVQHRITTRCAAHPQDDRSLPGRVAEMLLNIIIIGGDDNCDGVDPLRPLERADHVLQQRFAIQQQVLLGDVSAHPTALAGSRYECDMSNRVDPVFWF